jgi:hypothetical protein
MPHGAVIIAERPMASESNPSGEVEECSFFSARALVE